MPQTSLLFTRMLLHVVTSVMDADSVSYNSWHCLFHYVNSNANMKSCTWIKAASRWATNTDPKHVEKFILATRLILDDEELPHSTQWNKRNVIRIHMQSIWAFLHVNTSRGSTLLICITLLSFNPWLTVPTVGTEWDPKRISFHLESPSP